jgi:hypothetical protein
VRDEASRSELAHLTDWVLLAEGKPQEYGRWGWTAADAVVPLRLGRVEEGEERRIARVACGWTAMLATGNG